ncbi:MAG TPA: winged helix DNA-binding domain-containing protein [Jatrophihabitans sp.]|jgi:hypothetical protein|uniref:winged helix DNA-binding domain-containing protein n=1 Tax=Jatrophihabitans sp. TaxID=1932789 RepID=UPI002E04AE48|nr:winged helix DNA-binding domain-containing protein [Jatrophihabitans sp.]
MTTSAAVLRERIARHGLITRPSPSVVRAVALTTAIQAQEPHASRLGIRVRHATSTDAGVLADIATKRLVRTWLMRGTIHLVDAADVRWLVRLVGPAISRKYRTRWRQIGLSDDVLDASVAALPGILAGRPLTRPEIRDALAERGVVIDSPDTQAHTHALVHASTLGLVCRGPERGREATFTLLGDWVPDAPAGPSGDDALAELARRYFAAFSPATPADFTAWSGLPSTRAIELIGDELSAVEVGGRPGFRLGEVEPVRGVCLLPAFDNYLIGYRDRDAILPAAQRPRIYNGGMIHPAVLHDGRVIGSWALDRTKGHVRVSPFETLRPAVRRGVEAEIADLERFLGRELTFDLAAAG